MIKKVSEKDLSTISLMGNEYYDNFDKTYNLKYYLDNPNYIFNCFIEDEIIKGFILCDKTIDEIGIQMLYVDKKYRNMNIATSLLKNLEDYPCLKIFLEVSKENEVAYNLYKKCGYNIVTVRKGYYNGVDAYIMEKKL